MSTVDKRRLSDALKLIGKKTTTFESAWGQCLQDPSPLLKLCVSGVGDIPLPVSLTVFHICFVTKKEITSFTFQDIERVRKASSASTESKETLQLDASSLISFEPANFLQSGVSSLASKAISQLGINPQVIATEAHLEKLSLVPPGGSVGPRCIVEREPGKSTLIQSFLRLLLSFWPNRNVCYNDSPNPS